MKESILCAYTHFIQLPTHRHTYISQGWQWYFTDTDRVDKVSMKEWFPEILSQICWQNVWH